VDSIKTENVQPKNKIKSDKPKLTSEEKALRKERNELTKRDKSRFTATEIYCWAQVKSKVGHKEIAAAINRGVKQVYRNYKKIDAALKADYDLEGFRRLSFFGNIYQALDNVSYWLVRRDPQMTTTFMKGMGLFKEYIDDARPPGQGLSRNELEREIKRVCSASGIVVSFNGDPQTRPSRLVAGIDTPPQHGG
jgi:hypothetical protein